MKIGRLVLLGMFVFGASLSAEAATSAPRLHAHGAAKHVSLSAKDKKKHAHKVQKHKVAELHSAHKVKHVHHAKKVKH